MKPAFLGLMCGAAPKMSCCRCCSTPARTNAHTASAIDSLTSRRRSSCSRPRRPSRGAAGAARRAPRPALRRRSARRPGQQRAPGPQLRRRQRLRAGRGGPAAARRGDLEARHSAAAGRGGDHRGEATHLALAPRHRAPAAAARGRPEPAAPRRTHQQQQQVAARVRGCEERAAVGAGRRQGRAGPHDVERPLAALRRR